MRGEQHHSAKLTEADVRAILSQKGRPVAELAREYQVCQRTMWAVVTRQTWRGVKP